MKTSDLVLICVLSIATGCGKAEKVSENTAQEKKIAASALLPKQQSLEVVTETSSFSTEVPNHDLMMRALATPTDYEGFQDRTQAVKSLGEKKATEAIPLLLNKLTTITPMSLDNLTDWEKTYPCSSALIIMGTPAVPAVSSRLEATKSTTERMVLAYILEQIEGKEWLLNFLDEADKKPNNPIPEKKFSDLKGWILSR